MDKLCLLLNLEFWKYLFGKHSCRISKLKTIICRFRNHPFGIAWYNAQYLESDKCCKNCGDYLG